MCIHLGMGFRMALSEDLYDRAARAESNRLLLAAFGERIGELGGHMGFIDPVDWTCECANEICLESIELTVHDYEAVHHDGTCFIVAPSDAHFLPDIERVLEHHERYWVVERTGRVDVRGVPRERHLHLVPLPLHT